MKVTKQSFYSSSSAAIIVTGNIGEVTGETGTGGQTITGKTGEVTGSTGAVGHKAIFEQRENRVPRPQAEGWA